MEINQIEIIKGCFFKNKKGKEIEIYGFTMENEKMNVWAKESYIDSNNDIQTHQSLYYLEEIERLEINNEWLLEIGFKLHVKNLYELYDGNGIKLLSYNLKSKKIGICKDNNSRNHIWEKCQYVNMLQFWTTLIQIRKMFLPLR